jgi:hypothetical protein
MVASSCFAGYVREYSEPRAEADGTYFYYTPPHVRRVVITRFCRGNEGDIYRAKEIADGRPFRKYRGFPIGSLYSGDLLGWSTPATDFN